MEEEGLIKNPNLDIAQLAFLLQNDKENSDLRSQLIFHVQKNGEKRLSDKFNVNIY